MDIPTILKLVPFAAALTTSQDLYGACQDDNLVVNIPYPTVVTTDDILYFNAGTCGDWSSAETAGARLNYNPTNLTADFEIPIGACSLDASRHDSPITTRSSFY